MRIYIAGAMRGRKFYGFPQFDGAAARLRAWGYDVVNPADLDREVGFDALKISWPPDYNWQQITAGFDLQACIDRDIAALRTCDAIYMLRGWESSTGATAERAYMLWRGKDVYYEEKLSRDTDLQPKPEEEDENGHHIQNL